MKFWVIFQNLIVCQLIFVCLHKKGTKVGLIGYGGNLTRTQKMVWVLQDLSTEERYIKESWYPLLSRWRGLQDT